jgi:hypothetical protein
MTHEANSTARKVTDVHDILLDLEINENTPLLFIVLGADGSINRRGSEAGRVKKAEYRAPFLPSGMVPEGSSPSRLRFAAPRAALTASMRRS